MSDIQSQLERLEATYNAALDASAAKIKRLTNMLASSEAELRGADRVIFGLKAEIAILKKRLGE